MFSLGNMIKFYNNSKDEIISKVINSGVIRLKTEKNDVKLNLYTPINNNDVKFMPSYMSEVIQEDAFVKKIYKDKDYVLNNTTRITTTDQMGMSNPAEILLKRFEGKSIGFVRGKNKIIEKLNHVVNEDLKNIGIIKSNRIVNKLNYKFNGYDVYTVSIAVLLHDGYIDSIDEIKDINKIPMFIDNISMVFVKNNEMRVYSIDEDTVSISTFANTVNCYGYIIKYSFLPGVYNSIINKSKKTPSLLRYFSIEESIPTIDPKIEESKSEDKYLNKEDMEFIKKQLKEKYPLMGFYKLLPEKNKQVMFVYSFHNDKIKKLYDITITTDFKIKVINSMGVESRSMPKLNFNIVSLDNEEDTVNKFNKMGFNPYSIFDYYLEEMNLDYNSMYLEPKGFSYYIKKYPKIELALKDKNRGILIDIFNKGLRPDKVLNLNGKRPNDIFKLNNDRINMINMINEEFGFERYTYDVLNTVFTFEDLFEDFNYETLKKFYIFTKGCTDKDRLKIIKHFIDFEIEVGGEDIFFDCNEYPNLNLEENNWGYNVIKFKISDYTSKVSLFNYILSKYRSFDMSLDNHGNFFMYYSDYIKFRVSLGVKKGDNILPENLIGEHDNLSRKITNISNDRVFKSYEILNKYIKIPKDDNFTIVIPKKAKDLVNEGEKLSHCVGGYINRVDAMKSFIFFVRDKENIDKPLFTLEYRKIYSSENNYEYKRGDFRGRKNSLPTPKAALYVDRFEKLNKDYFKGQLDK